jgi:hypothetical protein
MINLCSYVNGFKYPGTWLLVPDHPTFGNNDFVLINKDYLSPQEAIELVKMLVVFS